LTQLRKLADTTHIGTQDNLGSLGIRGVQAQYCVFRYFLPNTHPENYHVGPSEIWGKKAELSTFGYRQTALSALK
jgi:hypothetical protein